MPEDRFACLLRLAPSGCHLGRIGLQDKGTVHLKGESSNQVFDELHVWERHLREADFNMEAPHRTFQKD